MVFSVLIVADDKHAHDAQQALQACKRVTGPMKVATSSKAHDAVAQLNQLASTAGHVDVALLHNHFTAPGKEQFSDALREVLKNKFPDTPVICFGTVDKGGKKGEHYHYGCEDCDPNELRDLLARAKAGDLPADYGGKGAKGRKSMDADPRRKSVDHSEAPSRKSMDRTASPARMAAAGSMRRGSLDPAPSMLGRRSMSLWDDGIGGASMSHGGAAAPDSPVLARTGSMTGVAPPMLDRMGSMSAMTGAAPPMLDRLGSMSAMAIDNMPLGRMSAGFAAPTMSPMAPMTPMMPMTGAMGGMGGMGGPIMAGGMGMTPMMPGMMGGAPMGGMGGMGAMQPMAGMGAMGFGMTPMAQPMVAPAVPAAPVAAPAPAAGAVSPDVTSLLASLNTSGNKAPGALAGSGNHQDVVHMLAEEVVRLRKALEEKRRASLDTHHNNNASIPTFRASQI